MEKVCPKCGKELPEESSFCLSCFYSFEPKNNKIKPPPFAGSSAKKSTSKPSKLIIAIILAILLFLIIMGVLIWAIKSSNTPDPEPQTPETTFISVTETIPVTQSNGEAVTDESGEQVFEVIEVTKAVTLPPPSTTEKHGFFETLFNKEPSSAQNSPGTSGTNNDKTASSTPGTSETTEKKSWWEILFGKDEETTAASTNTPTVPVATTPVTQNSTTATQPVTTRPSTATTITTTTTRPTTATTRPTTIQTTAVQTTASGSYHFEYAPQYASQPDGNIALTKYVGNATVVTIPSYVNGRKVAAIKADCFINDSRIQQIVFDDSTTYTISLNKHCFNNLSSLTKIVQKNKDIHLDPQFSINCPITYIGKDGVNDNKLVNGAYYKGSAFYWFTAHPSYTTLTLPDWCNKIDNGHNLFEVSNLKVINIHKDVTNVPYMPTVYNAGLMAINVESGHPVCFSYNGVLYSKGTNSSATSYSYCIYPNSKTNKVYKIPAGKKLVFEFGSGAPTWNNITNTYLEELWLPADATLQNNCSQQFQNNYPNLKKIFITPNHPQYENIKKNFNGTIIVTDF